MKKKSIKSTVAKRHEISEKTNFPENPNQDDIHKMLNQIDRWERDTKKWEKMAVS